MERQTLIERIVDIAYAEKLSHLGSYFSSVGIIDDIFSLKEKDDIFILSAGHCALALYVVLEKHLGHDAHTLFKKHGGHPHLCEELKFIYENNIKNIKIYVNVNGYAAYDSVDTKYLVERLKVFLPDIEIIYTEVGTFPFLRGLNAHYHIMSEKDYNLAKRILNNEA